MIKLIKKTDPNTLELQRTETSKLEQLRSELEKSSINELIRTDHSVKILPEVEEKYDEEKISLDQVLGEITEKDIKTNVTSSKKPPSPSISYVQKVKTAVTFQKKRRKGSVSQLDFPGTAREAASHLRRNSPSIRRKQSMSMMSTAKEAVQPSGSLSSRGAPKHDFPTTLGYMELNDHEEEKQNDLIVFPVLQKRTSSPQRRQTVSLTGRPTFNFPDETSQEADTAESETNVEVIGDPGHNRKGSAHKHPSTPTTPLSPPPTHIYPPPFPLPKEYTSDPDLTLSPQLSHKSSVDTEFEKEIDPKPKNLKTPKHTPVRKSKPPLGVGSGSKKSATTPPLVTPSSRSTKLRTKSKTMGRKGETQNKSGDVDALAQLKSMAMSLSPEKSNHYSQEPKKHEQSVTTKPDKLSPKALPKDSTTNPNTTEDSGSKSAPTTPKNYDEEEDMSQGNPWDVKSQRSSAVIPEKSNFKSPPTGNRGSFDLGEEESSGGSEETEGTKEEEDDEDRDLSDEDFQLDEKAVEMLKNYVAKNQNVDDEEAEEDFTFIRDFTVQNYFDMDGAATDDDEEKAKVIDPHEDETDKMSHWANQMSFGNEDLDSALDVLNRGFGAPRVSQSSSSSSMSSSDEESIETKVQTGGGGKKLPLGVSGDLGSKDEESESESD